MHPALAALLPLCLVVAGCSRTSPSGAGLPATLAPSGLTPPAGADVPHLRVLSFNVHYNLAEDPEVAEIVRDAGADLVLLQETTPGCEAALRRALGAAYPHVVFEHRPLAAGMGVLSRGPLRERRVVDPPEGGWFPALHVVAATPVGDVELVDVHLRPQVSESGSVLTGILTTSGAREREAQALVPLLSPDLPTVVAGDFNEAASGGAIGTFERAGLGRAPIDGYTWRWQTSLGEVHASLDHVLHDGALEVVRASRIERGKSDHLPLVVELRRRADRAGR